MLTTTKLPHTFWVKPITTIGYIQDYYYTYLIFNKTPFELWASMQPDLCHFHVFKCPIYDHVLDEKQQKLDSKTQKCIFVDYGDQYGIKGYHLYDQTFCQFSMSKNVIFDEEASFPTPYVESPNPHHHHKIICMMFPRNGFP